MDLAASTWWWLIAGALVAAELLSGTFYLLMLALGAAAGAVAAHLGWAASTQIVAAAVVGAATTLGWHLVRRRAAGAGRERDMNLDIGEQVDVATWHGDGTAQVQFRGSIWQARLDGDGTPAPGRHTIVRLDGNRLVLRRG
jgi:membrane protein implicated in regulation of membrane protease activity